MGVNDAAEMLEVAKAECVRLERALAEAQVTINNQIERGNRLANQVAVARSVQQPNREEAIERASMVMQEHYLDTLSAKISPDNHSSCICGGWSEGEMEPGWDDHLAEVLADAGLLAALPIPATGEVEYTVGMVNSDGRVSADDDDVVTDDIEEAREWVEDAIKGGTFSNAVLVNRPVSKWEVTP